MSLSIKITHELSPADITSAAQITALGFSRQNDAANYNDIYAHLTTAELLQLAHDDEKLVAFACYRRRLWPACT